MSYVKFADLGTPPTNGTFLQATFDPRANDDTYEDALQGTVYKPPSIVQAEPAKTYLLSGGYKSLDSTLVLNAMLSGTDVSGKTHPFKQNGGGDKDPLFFFAPNRDDDDNPKTTIADIGAAFGPFSDALYDRFEKYKDDIGTLTVTHFVRFYLTINTGNILLHMPNGYTVTFSKGSGDRFDHNFKEGATHEFKKDKYNAMKSVVEGASFKCHIGVAVHWKAGGGDEFYTIDVPVYKDLPEMYATSFPSPGTKDAKVSQVVETTAASASSGGQGGGSSSASRSSKEKGQARRSGPAEDQPATTVSSVPKGVDLGTVKLVQSHRSIGRNPKDAVDNADVQPFTPGGEAFQEHDELISIIEASKDKEGMNSILEYADEQRGYGAFDSPDDVRVIEALQKQIKTLDTNPTTP